MKCCDEVDQAKWKPIDILKEIKLILLWKDIYNKGI